MANIFKLSAYLVLLAIQCSAQAAAQVDPALVAVPSMESVFILMSAKSHSISPENPTGEKGEGGKADLTTGSARNAAKDLGLGWKVNPYVNVAPGSTFTIAQFNGEGIVTHIWMTLGGKAEYRSAIFRIYWDDEKGASVETPVGDFFGAGWSRKNEPKINSAAIAVNSGSGFNSFWPMPFRKSFRMTLENRSAVPLVIYYEVSFAETAVPVQAAYFHAQFRMVARLSLRTVYTIVDGIRGKGQYVGTSLSHGARSPGWWGEGEVKFYVDGDTSNPTINGTGEEDYFLGSYSYLRPAGKLPNGDTKFREENFSSLYSGFYSVMPLEETDPAYHGSRERRIGEYRWHIVDPIRFDRDLKVTIQGLGWKADDSGTYLPLRDSYASVAYWYQAEPHAEFPKLPSDAELSIRSDTTE
jgi:Protein of unknown function (DUF2961)